MENKDRYYYALIENDGQLNEIDLGEQEGLMETETRQVISQLLSEHRIVYEENGACNYSPIKTYKKKYKAK